MSDSKDIKEGDSFTEWFVVVFAAFLGVGFAVSAVMYAVLGACAAVVMSPFIALKLIIGPKSPWS